MSVVKVLTQVSEKHTFIRPASRKYSMDWRQMADTASKGVRTRTLEGSLGGPVSTSFKLKNQSHIGTPPCGALKPRQLKELRLKAIGAVGSYRNRALKITDDGLIRSRRKSFVFSVCPVTVELAS